MDLPVGLTGSVTIAFLVGFGIFLYPWLLVRPRGTLVVAALTAALTALFYFFDNPAESATSSSAVLALVWALAPVGTGVLVKRLRARAASTGNERGEHRDAGRKAGG